MNDKKKQPIVAATVKSKSSSLKSKFLAKLLLKPWLSCAQPNNQTLHQSTFYFAPSSSTSAPIYASMIETKLNSAVPTTNEHSHDEVHSNRAGDTGYETLTRYDAAELMIPPVSALFQANEDNEVEESDFEVTMTVNSYSGLGDVTLDSVKETKKVVPTQQSATNLNEPGCERFNEMRTRLIGDLIEMEANFVSYLSMAVATFSRPLRGFFIKQQDYFCLFQNIEKILVISENFLRSMDKWSAYDLYTKIGQLYSHKMSLFREAYTMYARGHHAAKSLLAELGQHSKQFRLFLAEVESNELTLERALDLPVSHVQRTLDIFKRIRGFTHESRRNPTEAPHIDSVIFELRSVLANLANSSVSAAAKGVSSVVFEDDDETMTSIEYTLSSIEEEEDDDEDDTTAEFTTITERVLNSQRQRRRVGRDDRDSCCSSSSSSEDSSEHDFDSTTLFLSPIH